MKALVPLIFGLLSLIFLYLSIPKSPPPSAIAHLPYRIRRRIAIIFAVVAALLMALL